MAWVSPTGFVDPDGKWGNIPDYEEDKAYDGDLVTMTMSDVITTGQWGSYLELTIDAISCDKIRFNTSGREGFIDEISIDVYYEDDWHNIYEGSYPNEIWTEKTIPAGTKSVTATRVKFHNSFFLDIEAELYEFEFNSIVAGWTGKISGVTNPAKVMGVPVANIAKVKGVSSA